MSSTNPTDSPQDWINLDRYPIHKLHTDAGQALIERCRQDIARTAGSQLDGFLLPDALCRLGDEARDVAPMALRRDTYRSAYGWMENDDFDEDHPRAWPQHDRKGTVHYDLYPPEALIRRLYEWQPLADFIATVLREEHLFICDDPVMSVVLSIMGGGDEQGWHFDTNDYSVTLCLQAPEAGGAFQCAPYVRSDGEENYNRVAEIFRGEIQPEVDVTPEPGTLTMFRGRRSVHRVDAVEGELDRLMVIFSYHRELGFRWPEAMIQLSKNAGAM